MENTYNRVYIWCCKYGENRYCERYANKKWCASKHTSLLKSCLGKSSLHPYLVVPLISARVTLISTRVSAHCQAILLFEMLRDVFVFKTIPWHWNCAGSLSLPWRNDLIRKDMQLILCLQMTGSHNTSSNDSHIYFDGLTHWGRDKIDAPSQMTFSYAFSWMKMNEFRLGFHWSLFLRFELTIFQHWFR